MLYHLFYPLAQENSIFNVFQYLSFRIGGAVITAMLISFLIGPATIKWMREKQGKGQPIRSDGPEGHFLKAGTPTMGGVMILVSLLVSMLLWARLDNVYVWAVMGVTLAFGLLGFVDDYLKVSKQNTDGVRGSGKLIVQFIVAIVVSYFMIKTFEAGATDEYKHLATQVAMPFFKDLYLPLGLFLMIAFMSLVIVGASNSVNITDGLDGLAIVPVMIASGAYLAIAYIVGNIIISDYLHVTYVQGAGEISIIMASVVGAGLGFLWFNAPPAQIFMGDTGSLSLGGTIGTAAVVTKQEVVLAIIGGLFVMESLSVMIQIAYFKLTGKRIFLMAPIHHHFEKLGWHESTIVIRFWIVALVLAIIGLGTLKLR